MANKDDQHHHHHKIHYASILPPKPNNNRYDSPHSNRRRLDQQQQQQQQQQPQQSKALYLDFEGAFQDEMATVDYFGFQSSENNQHNSRPVANFHLQSVETISEIQNVHFSPSIRYQASRETSHSSTPSDTPQPQLRFNRHSNPSSLLPSQSHYLSTLNDHDRLNRDLTKLNMVSNNDQKHLSIPYPSEPIRTRTKPIDINPNSSSERKIILPQYFLVKYLGRVPCVQLWGAKAVRGPIDDLVRASRQLSSMDEIPTLEACVSTRGLVLTHRNVQSNSKQNHTRNQSPDRHHHGLIPLENVSYAMHDIKYSKVASCIVMRQAKTVSTNASISTTETVTECYAFLFQSKEHAHRFALALAEAFDTQKQSSRTSRNNHDNKRDGRSPPHRSRHRSAYPHERARTDTKHDNNYLRDSEV